MPRPIHPPRAANALSTGGRRPAVEREPAASRATGAGPAAPQLGGPRHAAQRRQIAAAFGPGHAQAPPLQARFMLPDRQPLADALPLQALIAQLPPALREPAEGDFVKRFKADGDHDLLAFLLSLHLQLQAQPASAEKGPALVAVDTQIATLRQQADQRFEAARTSPAQPRGTPSGPEQALAALFERGGREPGGEDVALMRQAHAATDVATLTAAQQGYQARLVSELNLPPAAINEFHRSAGFEYEFAGFSAASLLPDANGELLPSHVELAASAPLSAVFGLPFKLETDSNNELELVTPPLLFLDAPGVGDAIRQADQAYRAHIQADRAPQDLQTWITNRAEGPLGTGWHRVGGPGDLRLAADNKHSGKVYSQLNVSLTAGEIAGLVDRLAEAKRSDSMTPVEDFALQLREQLLSGLPDDGDGRAARPACSLYARAVASLLGIPGIHYRRTQGRRPNAEATQIKEALGVWAKDHPDAIIADALLDAGPGAAAAFSGRLLAVQAWARQALDQRVEAAVRQLFPKQAFDRAAELRRLKEGGTPPNQLLAAVTPLTTQHEQNETQRIAGLVATYRNLVVSELAGMTAHLQTLLLRQAVVRPAKPAFLAEDFTAGPPGHGVRKDTFLPTSVGDTRRTRVAEVRDSDALGALFQHKR